MDARVDGDGDGRAAAAGDGQVGGLGQHGGDEDHVGEQVPAVGRAERVARALNRLGRRPVPVHELVLLDGRLVGPGLVRSDVGSVERLEPLVRVAVGPGA